MCGHKIDPFSKRKLLRTKDERATVQIMKKLFLYAVLLLTVPASATLAQERWPDAPDKDWKYFEPEEESQDRDWKYFKPENEKREFYDASRSKKSGCTNAKPRRWGQNMETKDDDQRHHSGGAGSDCRY